MGLFDRFLGRRPEERGRFRPKIALEMQGGNQVVIENGNGVATIMDRDMYDYMYGDRQGPDPAQADLDALMPRVTRVRAIASGMAGGKATGDEVVLETIDPAAIGGLAQALKIDGDPRTFGHCSCQGGPTLALFGGDELLAEIGLQHGSSIRWGRWRHDARLLDGRGLTEWLKVHGFESEFLDLMLKNHYEGSWLSPLGLKRGGPAPLTRGEQRVRLAELRRVRGRDPDGAAEICRQVIESGDGAGFAHGVLGLIRRQQGDWVACVKECTLAIGLGFHAAQVYLARGVAHDMMKEPEEALGDCDAAIELNPRDADAFNSRALIRGRVGRLEGALSDLDEAIRLAPEWGLPYLNRATTHIRMGDQAACIADCTWLIEHAKQDADPARRGLTAMAYWNRAQALRQRGDMRGAEADFQAALKLNPNLGNPGFEAI
ncbi:MAG: tetratricopeptide repeat protein [Isosphaeraceae bacterium]